MATRKPGFLYPSVAIKAHSSVHLHLDAYAEARHLTLGQAINTILGDWADALDGKPSPFGSSILLGGATASAGMSEETRQQEERQAQEARAREERVANSASQWT